MTRVSLDANILVYALHADDRRHDRAATIVKRAAWNDCVLTVQSMAECFNVLVKKRGIAPETARREIATLREAIPHASQQIVDLDEAMTAVAEHRIAFWDAMLWATARRAGCEVIVSEDFQDGRTLGEVRFINPFHVKNDEAIDRLFAEDPLS